MFRPHFQIQTNERQTYVRYCMYMAFLSDKDAVGLYINTDPTIHDQNEFMVQGTAILFPSISAASALQQTIVIKKRVNRRGVEKTMTITRYVVSFQGRVHGTLKAAVYHIHFYTSSITRFVTLTNSHFLYSDKRVLPFTGADTCVLQG